MALMHAVSHGQKDALKILLDIYMPVVSRVTYRILCDQAESDEVTRRIFVRIWNDAPWADGRSGGEIWIYRTACRMCRGRIFRRKILDLLSISPSLYETSAPYADEDDFITKEAWEIFCRASRNMSSWERIVYSLCDLEELPMSVVREVTGMSAARIHDRLHMAREKLKSELEIYGKVR